MRQLTKTITIILFSALFTRLSAQTIVAGKVKDNRSKPIAGASITLKDTYDGTTSDSTGKFKFKTSEKGDFIIIFS